MRDSCSQKLIILPVTQHFKVQVERKRHHRDALYRHEAAKLVREPLLAYFSNARKNQINDRGQNLVDSMQRRPSHPERRISCSTIESSFLIALRQDKSKNCFFVFAQIRNEKRDSFTQPDVVLPGGILIIHTFRFRLNMQKI